MAILRPGRQPKSRTRLPRGYAPTVPALEWTAAIVATKARITTNLPYTLDGSIPPITVQGVAPTSITPISATVFELDYAANVVSTNVITVPANLTGVRSQIGGNLAAGSFTFP